MESTVLISMSKADLSRLIVEAVSATLKVQAPELAPVGIEEAQRITGLSRSTIYKMTSSNQFPISLSANWASSVISREVPF